MTLGQGRKITWRSTVPVWLFLGLASGLFCLSPPGQWIEKTLAKPWLFQTRGVRTPPEGVVVVSLDKRGSDLPAVTRSDRLWSRRLFASLIDQLTAAGAAVIVMDVTFEDTGEAASDSALEQSLLRSQRTLLFKRVTRTQDGDVTVSPIPRFANAARGLAVFALPKTARVDAYWPFFPALEKQADSLEYKEFPSLPVAALQLRLLDELGAPAFENLLLQPALAADTEWNTNTSSQTTLSVLMSGLRSRFSDSQMPRTSSIRLSRDSTGTSLPIADMLASLHLAYSTQGMLPLNFYGPPHTIPTITHLSVLPDTGERLPTLEQWVSDKVVFIGHSPLDPIDQLDGMPTVFTRDGLDLSGVEIAATAYANLLDGSILQPAPVLLSVAVHVMLALIGAFLALRASMTGAVALTVLLAASYFATCLWSFTVAYRVLPLGVPLLALLPLTLFTVLLLRYCFTDRQAGVYRYGIQQLLPARATAALELSGIGESGHELLYGTCMITDIENFTHYAEKLGHGHIATLSQEYFSYTIKTIVDSGGELFSVDGDGITAFWGNVEQSNDSGVQATQAAIGIMDNVRQFNQRYPDTPFVTRMGLEIGWVQTRYLGSEGGLRYCLVGDTANTSSRLETLNKRLGTSTLASSAVINACGAIPNRPLGAFLLKGKSVPLEVFEIMDRMAVDTATPAQISEEFSFALSLLRQGQTDAAERQFLDFLQSYGTDGPARFYLELLNGRGAPDVHLDAKGIVHVLGK